MKLASPERLFILQKVKQRAENWNLYYARKLFIYLLPRAFGQARKYLLARIIHIHDYDDLFIQNEMTLIPKLSASSFSYQKG
jgi:hypothetical protein